MQRTTIMLPEDLKLRAYQIAHQAGISLGELIRESIEEHLNKSILMRKEPIDPFFADKNIYHGKVAKDVAEKHDDYLYEQLK